MTVTLGILALLEAKAGKGDQLAAFLKAGRDMAVAEQGTVTWYAFKISDTSYGIFDTFATGDARTAHRGVRAVTAARWLSDALSGHEDLDDAGSQMAARPQGVEGTDDSHSGADPRLAA